jgi:hypothetical protein
VTYRELAMAMGLKNHVPVYQFARGFSATAEDKRAILKGLHSMGLSVAEKDLW